MFVYGMLAGVIVGGGIGVALMALMIIGREADEASKGTYDDGFARGYVEGYEDGKEDEIHENTTRWRERR